MPKTPSSGFYHQPFLWRIAGARMIIRCYCGWCRRAQHYLAMDLVPIFGSDAVVGQLWGCCPRCGKADRWTEQERLPTGDDVGNLVIRRPAGLKAVQLWADDFYGPAPYGPPWPPPPTMGSVPPRQYEGLTLANPSPWDQDA